MVRSGRAAVVAALALASLALLPAGELAAQFEVEGRAASLRVGGRVHLQARHDSPDDSPAETFFVRRARITADVKVGDFLDGRLQPEFSGSGSLQDAWVRLSVAPSFRVSMGQFKRAHEGFELASSTELAVIERDGRISGTADCAGVGGVCSLSRLTTVLGFSGRDAGLRVEGRLGGGVSYLATLTNGSGPNRTDDNEAKSYSGRLSWRAADNLTLSGYYGVHDYLVPSNVDETDHGGAGGIEVEVGPYRDGFRLHAGIVAGDNWRAGPDVGFLAAQGIASWYHPTEGGRWAAFEPILRVAWTDADTDAADDAALLVTPGLHLYVQGRNRIGVNVDVYDPGSGDSAWSFKFQTALYF